MRYIATFWSLVRLLSCFLVDLQYLSCAQGGERDLIRLRVPGVDGEPFTLATDVSWRKFGGTGANVLSANHLLCQLLASAVGGRLYVCTVQCGRLLKMLGVKGW